MSAQIELKNCVNKDLYGLRIKSESIINECANKYNKTEDDKIIMEYKKNMNAAKLSIPIDCIKPKI